MLCLPCSVLLSNQTTDTTLATNLRIVCYNSLYLSAATFVRYASNSHFHLYPQLAWRLLHTCTNACT